MSYKHITAGVRLLEQDCKYNSRAKFYPRSDGSLKLVEEMYCNRFIFNPDNVSLAKSERRLRHEEFKEILKEEYGVNQHHVKNEPDPRDNVERSRRRAKNKIFDLIRCNEFKYFVTLTFNPDIIDSFDYNAVVKKINSYLGNRVRRNGLCYVGVPEKHKSGRFHFHFLCNNVLHLVHSGTYIRPAGGKPVKADTCRKQGVNIEDCKSVYNIVDWSLGWSTAIELYGDINAVANYVGKYITKASDKVGGRWYYSGGDLVKPIFRYDRVSFNDCDFDYMYDCDGGKFKIKRFDT